MSDLPWRPSRLVAALAILLLGAAAAGTPYKSALAVEPADLEDGLDILTKRRLVSLDEAMTSLAVPSVSVALIEGDRNIFTRAYGQGATPETLYQAASLSKFVAAVGAMRLVDQKKLALDEDVNAKLTSWKVPTNGFDKNHPMTLRGLLSMTAGIGVPGSLATRLGRLCRI
jgi:CubicO group peptidase (beta-lactamase class C family)